MPVRVERFTFRGRNYVPLEEKGIQRLVWKDGEGRERFEELSKATGGAIVARGVGMGLDKEAIPWTRRIWVAENILRVEKKKGEK